MTTQASRSGTNIDVGFIRRAGKALVIMGFVALCLTAWVIVGEHQAGGITGVPIGLLLISYGIDVVGHPRQRRVLGPKDMSEWLLAVLARLPPAAALHDPIGRRTTEMPANQDPDVQLTQRITTGEGCSSPDLDAGPGQAAA
jgi:hypothetical protein